MNVDKEAEKLTLEERKIIHILLKHLMEMRNEIAYLKNKAGLNTDNKGIAEKSIGIKKSDITTSRLGSGIINDDINTSCLGSGIINNDINTSCLGSGINNDDISKSSLGSGINTSDISKSSLGSGINTSDYTKPQTGSAYITDDLGNPKEGIAYITDGLSNPKELIERINDDVSNPRKGIDGTNDEIRNPKKSIAINNLVVALSAMEGTTNDADWLYSFFEEALINAIEEYIRNGNGQATLYTFYADFLEAIADKNSLEERPKEAKTILRLEDTHILPMEIPADAVSLIMLSAALNGHLSVSSKQNMYLNIALELLFLHNTGTAKQAQLIKVTGMSTSGFAKHLPKVIQYGLIKALPSKNYALTDKSIYILLELFGIKKEL